MRKRLLGVFLTVCMVLTMLPAAALADTPAQAQWDVARSNGSAPTEWVNSGTLADAMTYANSLSSGTAYIQLVMSGEADTAASAAQDIKNTNGNRYPASALSAAQYAQ